MIVYRIVETDPPTFGDFQPPKERGKSPDDPDPEVARLYEGISVYATEAQALRKAKVSWRLGSFIAQLDIPDGGPIQYERTTKSRGHYTLWGDAQVIWDCMVNISSAIR